MHAILVCHLLCIIKQTLDGSEDPKDPNDCSAHCGSNTIRTKPTVNATCTCECKPAYVGNPYLGCRPGCLLNSDCPFEQACLSNQCKDPCPGVCGHNSLCIVTNQRPSCLCKKGHGGNPYEGCSPTTSTTTTTTTSTISTTITTTTSNTSSNYCKSQFKT